MNPLDLAELDAAGLADLPVLSIRQPWAWAILHAGKDVENRTRRSNYRGRFLIHAAMGCTFEEWYLAADSINRHRKAGCEPVPVLSRLLRGGIVGVATQVMCGNRFDSVWFSGPFGYALTDARPLPRLYPRKGRLGFFHLR